MPGLPAWNTSTPSMPHYSSSLISTNPRNTTSVLENQPSPYQLNTTKKTTGSKAQVSTCHLLGVTPGRSNDRASMIPSCGWGEARVSSCIGYEGIRTLRTSTCFTPQAQVSGEKNGPRFTRVPGGKMLISKFRFRWEIRALIYLKANVYT